MFLLAYSDRNFGEQELAYAVSLCKRIGIDNAEIFVDSLVIEIQAGKINDLGFNTDPEYRAIFKYLVEMATMDGKVTESEKSILLRAGEKIGFSAIESEAIVEEYLARKRKKW